MPVSSFPLLDEGIELFPATEVKVTDAKICPLRLCKYLLQRGEKIPLDIVEDSGHVLNGGVSAFVDL